MFIQTIKQKLKDNDFQNDWLTNDSEQIEENKEEEADLTGQLTQMSELENMMDDILLDT